jgi:hypothetical protein
MTFCGSNIRRELSRIDWQGSNQELKSIDVVPMELIGHSFSVEDE